MSYLINAFLSAAGAAETFIERLLPGTGTLADSSDESFEMLIPGGGSWNG